MAFYSVTSFWYDDVTGNMFIQLAEEVDVTYEYLPEEEPLDLYEAQIFLDGSVNLVGKYRPSSTDGTIQGGYFGKQIGVSPDTPEVQPIENAPE